MVEIYRSSLSSEAALLPPAAQGQFCSSAQDSLLTLSQMSCYQLSIWHSSRRSSSFKAKLMVASRLLNKALSWFALMFEAKPRVAHCSSAAPLPAECLSGCWVPREACLHLAPPAQRGSQESSKQSTEMWHQAVSLSPCIPYWWHGAPSPRQATALCQDTCHRGTERLRSRGGCHRGAKHSSPTAEAEVLPALGFPRRDTEISKLLASPALPTLPGDTNSRCHRWWAWPMFYTKHVSGLFSPLHILITILYSRCLNVLNELLRTLEAFISAHRQFIVYPF